MDDQPLRLHRLHYVTETNPGDMVVNGELATEEQKASALLFDFPSKYAEVKTDIRRFFKRKIEDVVVRKRGYVYAGIINAEGELYLYALSSTGFRHKKIEDVEKGWALFLKLREEEDQESLEWRRQVSANAHDKSRG
jgi:Na+-transporting NADH:ubiquinone oxidoreductase subunit NqrA